MPTQIDEYFAFDPALFRREPNIVEVGCFEPAKRLPLCLRCNAKLHFVEASPTNYATLVSRIPKEAHAVSALNAALSDHDGPITLYEGDHEQVATVFPRHLCDGMKLRRSVRVQGYRLCALLDKLGVETCDLLLLNCEGAEIFAMRQLADPADAGLRARVRQFSTSNHCAHIHCYPQALWDRLVADLAPHYAAARLAFPSIPYFLFVRSV